jgi:NAD(P)-dependent dehydrogenase (short-subunit alcohol dehydrogenase family)
MDINAKGTFFCSQQAEAKAMIPKKYGIRVNCISPGVTRVEGLFPEVILDGGYTIM